MTAAVYPVRRRLDLIWVMAKREITDRYAGQALGAFWAFGHPLLVMAVYLFVFSFVFKMRVASVPGASFDYPVYLLSGLIPWLAIADAINKSSTAITNNASLVKQVVFPLEVLPLKTVLASLLPQAVSMAVLAIYTLVTFKFLPQTYWLLPVVIALELIFLAGAALLLAAIGAYVRDLKDVIQVLMVVGVYVLPIFYLPEMVPAQFRPLIALNPLSHLINCFRDVHFFGHIASPASWIVSTVLSLGTFVVGWSLFHRLKVGFGNVL